MKSRKFTRIKSVQEFMCPGVQVSVVCVEVAVMMRGADDAKRKSSSHRGIIFNANVNSFSTSAYGATMYNLLSDLLHVVFHHDISESAFKGNVSAAKSQKKRGKQRNSKAITTIRSAMERYRFYPSRTSSRHIIYIRDKRALAPAQVSSPLGLIWSGGRTNPFRPVSRNSAAKPSSNLPTSMAQSTLSPLTW